MFATPRAEILCTERTTTTKSRMTTNRTSSTNHNSARSRLLILTGATLLALATDAGAQCTEFTTGLLRPLSAVQSKKGNLIVSENGTPTANTGRISIVDPAGTRRTLIEGLPSGISYETNSPSGPTGLFLRGRTLYALIGVGDSVLAGPNQGTVRPNPDPASPLLSSVLAIHFSAAVEKNTQGFLLTPAHQQTLASGESVTLTNPAAETIRIELIANFPNFTPDPRPDFAENVRHSNPFALIALGSSLYVTDGAQNSIWRVDLASRQFTTLTRFANIPNPAFNPNPPPPSQGGPFLEAVPTGIEFSDGQLLVTLFRGFPFPAGSSAVVRVDPISGSQSTFISGLKTAIDILPVRTDDDPGGATKHLVMQHASGNLLAPPGLLLRFDTPNAAPTTLASCLTTPSSMTLDEESGTLYVTELTGRVVAIAVAAEARESDTGVAPIVRNISTRGRVGTGEDVMIAGVIVGQGSGGGAIRTVVRAIAPSLGSKGIERLLPDPVLTLHDANGTEIARNDNWKGDAGQPSQEADIKATGLAPTADAESALLAVLMPGDYTAIVSGKDQDSGVALVEVYHVQ